MTRGEMIVLGFGVMLGHSNEATGLSSSAKLRVMPPPWPGNGRSLWEMVIREAEWAKAREPVATIGHWPWLMNQFRSDEQMRRVFAAIRSLRVGPGFEVPALKSAPWMQERRRAPSNPFPYVSIG